mmetsp:Transcript_17097/g.42720  ORF Transcript_17097/g.42720 Transcript_17097/m.42720 type:complete len:212 (-) Transcript_17097:534-1169(-)
MDIQNCGWFHQFQSDGFDLVFVDIVHRFVFWRFQKIPHGIHVDPVRLVEHDTQLGISLRNNIDRSIREIAVANQYPLLFPIQIDSSQHQIVLSRREQIPILAQKLFLFVRTRNLEIIPEVLFDLRKILRNIQHSRQQCLFDIGSGILQDIPTSPSMRRSLQNIDSFGFSIIFRFLVLRLLLLPRRYIDAVVNGRKGFIEFHQAWYIKCRPL